MRLLLVFISTLLGELRLDTFKPVEIRNFINTGRGKHKRNPKQGGAYVISPRERLGRYM